MPDNLRDMRPESIPKGNPREWEMLERIRERSHVPVVPPVLGTPVPYDHATYARTWAPTAVEVAAEQERERLAREAFPAPVRAAVRLRTDGSDPMPANALKLAQRAAQGRWTVVATRATGTLMAGDGLPVETITWAQVPDEDGTPHRRKVGGVPVGPQDSFLVRCFRHPTRAALVADERVSVLAGWWIGGALNAKGKWAGAAFERGTVAWPMRGATWAQVWDAVQEHVVPA